MIKFLKHEGFSVRSELPQGNEPVDLMRDLPRGRKEHILDDLQKLVDEV